MKQAKLSVSGYLHRGRRIPKERKHRFSLTLLFSAVLMIIFLTAIVLATLAVWLCNKLGIFSQAIDEMNLWMVAVLTGGISLLIGATLSLLFGKFSLRPINTLINHINRLASGNFRTRLHFGGMIADHPIFNEISDSFNTLAEELEHTELLREDFINSFSHEFKSPIVSIAGLAKLLNRDDLPEDRRRQYLTAIEEESLRLANMATNVLNLTKVENQTILTDVKLLNVSEQIRSCVLLLENRWTKKEIDLQLDFDEYFAEANEDLLKQVWMNLLDNAIKFSPKGGTVTVTIGQREHGLSVSISNFGEPIPQEARKMLFHKFYQADESHASEGNGLGLAIVHRIVALHEGQIAVFCEDHTIRFQVDLPQNGDPIRSSKQA